MSGEQIRELRLRLGLTQEQFARVVGVTFTTVNRWERDWNTPRGLSLRALERVARQHRKPEAATA